jgi:hypothetical protein
MSRMIIVLIIERTDLHTKTPDAQWYSVGIRSFTLQKIKLALLL